MSTDRLAGETPPEQEAAPGTADAQTPEDTTAPGADASAPEASADPSEDATTPEHSANPGEDATTPEDSANPARGRNDAEDSADPRLGRRPRLRTAPRLRAGRDGERAGARGSRRRGRDPGLRCGAAAFGVRVGQGDRGRAGGGRAGRGERRARGRFVLQRRPALRQTGRARRPFPQDARDSGAGTPQGGPTGPAPEVARPRTAEEAGGPARPPVVDGGAMNPAGAAAPAGPAPAARPAMTTAPGIEGVRQVLAAGGAPETLAGPAAEALGERAAEALSEDPWQLLGVPGVRPEQADGFARALLGPACGPGDERRAQALVGWLLEQAAVAGHSALEAAALRAALAQRVGARPRRGPPDRHRGRRRAGLPGRDRGAGPRPSRRG